MGFLKRNRTSTDQPKHRELRLPTWDEMALIDPQASKHDLQAGMEMTESIVNEPTDSVDRVLDEADTHVRAVIPHLVNVPGMPSTPEDVAFDFATGWRLADLEVSRGLARDGQSSEAAIMAMSFLRQATIPEDRAFIGSKAMNAGYYARRTRCDAETLVALLISGRTA
jgi:hypothetical protein